MWNNSPAASSTSSANTSSFFGLGLRRSARKKKGGKQQSDDEEEDEELDEMAAQQQQQQDAGSINSSEEDENVTLRQQQRRRVVGDSSLFFASSGSIHQLLAEGGSGDEDEEGENGADGEEDEEAARDENAEPKCSQVSSQALVGLQSTMNTVFTGFLGGRPRFGAKAKLFDAAEDKQLHSVRQLQQPKERRKRRRYRPGTKALMEIRQFQKTTRCLIPRAPFARFVKEIMDDMAPGRAHRVQTEAITALQESTEAYLVTFFEAANRCAIHARRVTVMPRDFVLLRWILTAFGINIV